MIHAPMYDDTWQPKLLCITVVYIESARETTKQSDADNILEPAISSDRVLMNPALLVDCRLATLTRLNTEP